MTIRKTIGTFAFSVLLACLGSLAPIQSISPISTAFAQSVSPINVKSFGCYGDNSHDDAACVQKAINFARTQNHGTIVFPNAVGYLVKSALDVTATSGIRFIGEGGNNTSYVTIYADHTGHVFDLSGSSNIVFENIAIRAVAANKPISAWFMARNQAANSAGQHSFSYCQAYGSFTGAVVYSYGSESNEYRFVNFQNLNAAGKAVVITGNNIQSLTSTFITIAAGSQSNIATSFFGGSLFANATGNADALYLESASLVRMYATELFSSNGVTGGRSLVYVDTTNGPSDYLTFDSIIGENFGGAANPAYGFYFGDTAANGANAIGTFTVRSSRVATVTNTIFTHDNVEINGLSLNDLNDIGTAPGSSYWKVTGGWIRGSPHVFRSNVNSSILIGAVSAFTFSGTRASTVIQDPNTASFDQLRIGTTTQPTNPTDVIVATATPTTIFDAAIYMGGSQATEFCAFSPTTIYGCGRIIRNGSGTWAVALLLPNLGTGLAFTMSGSNVQLTHTSGINQTISTRIYPTLSNAP